MRRSPLRALPRGTRPLIVMVAASLTAASCSVIGGGGATYTLDAKFIRAEGVYPGSFVRELGLDIGEVTKVTNEGPDVDVKMAVKRKYPLRPDAQAVLVGDSLLGERFVQFTPAWTGGPRLADGSVIPVSRTVIPVETDQVLRSLSRVLNTIDPNNVSALVTNLADIVNGNGAKINDLLGHAATTLSLLATKSNDLGKLVNSLASLTGALDSHSATIAELIRDYDTVSQVLADNRQNLDSTITNLTSATSQSADLLNTNLSGLHDDINVLTTAGQTLDRNFDELDTGLANAPRLFSAAKRAYDPVHNWLPLNNQFSGAANSEVLAARVRDRLAGLCRRVAHRDPSLAPSLAACGNPSSGFFDPIIGLLPQAVGNLPGQTAPLSSAGGPGASSRAASVRLPGAAAPATAEAAFAAGVNAIPGLSSAERASLGATLPASAGAVSDSGTVLDPGQILGPLPPLHNAPAHRNWLQRFWSWSVHLGGLW